MNSQQKEKHNDVNDLCGRLQRSRPAEDLRCPRSSASENLLIACKKQGMAMTAGEITVGTWNVQTLWQTGRLQMLEKELEKMRYDVIGLSEVRWTGTGEALHGRLIYTGEQERRKRRGHSDERESQEGPHSL